MMKIVSKAPQEDILLCFDFTDFLSEGATITGTPTVIVQATHGLDTSAADRKTSSPTSVGTAVNQRIGGGPLAERYSVICRVSTSDGQLLETGFFVLNRDPNDC